MEVFISYFYVLIHLNMKNITIILAISLFVMSSCSRFNLGNKAEMDALSAKVDSLTTLVDTLSAQNKFQDDEISWLEIQIGELNQIKEPKPATPATETKPTARAKTPAVTPAKTVVKVAPDLQCIAITNAGKRCSRPAVKGSKYCLQHKLIYEPDK